MSDQEFVIDLVDQFARQNPDVPRASVWAFVHQVTRRSLVDGAWLDGDLPVSPGGKVRAASFYVLANAEFHAGRFSVPCNMSNADCPFIECKTPANYADALDVNSDSFELREARETVLVCSVCDQDLACSARLIADWRCRRDEADLDREFGRVIEREV